jgi:hypothetical protein
MNRADAAAREPANSAPQPPHVARVLKMLDKARQEALVDLLCEPYGSLDFEQFGLGRELEVQVVDWCVDYEGAIADLLNAVMKRRPECTGIQDFVNKLAEEGFIALD